MKLRVINTEGKTEMGNPKKGFDAVVEHDEPMMDGSFREVIGIGYKTTEDAASAIRMWLYNQREG